MPGESKNESKHESLPASVTRLLGRKKKFCSVWFLRQAVNGSKNKIIRKNDKRLKKKNDVGLFVSHKQPRSQALFPFPPPCRQSRTQSPQAPWSAVWSPGETLGKWNFFNFFDWLFG